MEAVPLNGRESVRFELRRHADIASGTYFEKGDVLLSKITPSFENGKQGLAHNIPTSFGIASTEIIPLQAATADANHRFLFFYLLHPEVRAALVGKMEGSTGRQRVPEGAVCEFLIPMPPGPEQDKIAALLWKIQRTLEVEGKLVSTTRELKQSTMRQLLTHGLRNEPQKETDIGLIPKSWGIQPLEQLREFLQYGTSVKCGYTKKGSPVIRIPNVMDGKVSCDDLKWCELSEKEIESLALEGGDILFIRTNGVRDRVGTCAVYCGQPERALFASYLIRARLKTDQLDPSFFQYFTATAAGFAQLGGQASPAADGKFNVNTKTIDIDRKISVHERKRAALSDLFQTMLHQLMSAHIRVDKLDIDTSEVAALNSETA
ncbi:MAG: hypothetical protein DME22_11585 [Verrucomicrobia bacterium]|nr:MAG: hypothetical protein DME22_11585 [Verrucomicrobiota bacterium]